MTSKESHPASPKPQDVLLVGDSMLRRLQVNNQPVRVWKFCYPGGTAEDLHDHFPTEKLPGESLIGAVLVNIGTNDLSRSRGRARTLDEVTHYLQSLMKRLTKMYPQAKVVYCSILPRLDLDDHRVELVNARMFSFMREFSPKSSYFDYSAAYRDLDQSVKRDYYRDTNEDVVHLSSSGTQVQQDVFNQYFIRLQNLMRESKVDCTKLMWQSEWEYFNHWNVKNVNVRPNPYLERKRITNFGSEHYQAILDHERTQSTNRIWNI